MNMMHFCCIIRMSDYVIHFPSTHRTLLTWNKIHTSLDRCSHLQIWTNLDRKAAVPVHFSLSYWILFKSINIQSKKFALGFPRDGTSRDKPGWGVPLSLCPGTKKFPCLIVPLSRDKKFLPVPLSLCPGTRAGANVPGQSPLSRDVPGQNEFLKILKKGQISCFRTSFSVLEHPFAVWEHPCLLGPVLSRGPARFLAVPARPVPDFSCPCPSRPVARFWACPAHWYFRTF